MDAKQPPTRLEALVHRLDHPMLVLAAASVVIYLLDMRGLLADPRLHRILSVSEGVIDCVFVADLCLKLAALGRSYAWSPWFMIDGISALPILAVLGPRLAPLRAIRFVRGLRVERALRSLRALQLLESIPAFRHYTDAEPDAEASKRFERATTIGVIVYSAALMFVIIGVRRASVSDFRAAVGERLRQPIVSADLGKLGGSLSADDFESSIEMTADVDGRSRVVYFDRGLAERSANLFEFYLVGGTVVGMLLIIYIGFHHLQDVSSNHLRAFLHVALPRQVADQAIKNPESYHDKCKMPASIVFMDIRGFTASCEKLGDDLDALSKHLEGAMDTVVRHLNKHDLIVDKFIGDAIMSFRGGPLVSGGDGENAYRIVRASLDASLALSELGDPFFKAMKVGGASAPDCLIGAFGTSTRLSYTILGDGVNLAARLEPASGQCGTRNLFCETTRKLCEGRTDLKWRRWGQIRVQGKAFPLNVYEAFDAAVSPNHGFLEAYEEGLAAYEKKDIKRALELFRKAESARKEGDAPSREHIEWCEALLKTGLPENWEPVAVAKK